MNGLTVTRGGWTALGLLLRQSRERAGWSLADLVEKAKESNDSATLGRSTISHIERGNVEPKIGTLMILSSLKYIRHPTTEKEMDVQDLCEYAAEHSDN